VIIDEAGMLGSRQTERLMREIEVSQAKAVSGGDSQQLQAIEAGGAFRATIETAGFIELTDIRRQQVPWQREATLELAKGQVEHALEKYRAHDNVHTFETQGEAKARLIDQWNDARHGNPQETQLIMAYTRKDVKELNDLARELMKRDGELGQDTTFELARGERQLAVNDRVYFLKRDDGLRVVNGTLGTIKRMDDKTGRLHVELDRDDLNPRDRLVTVDTKRYKELDHGYAATVYKAQGVTVDRAYMLTSKHYDAHSTYVGMSRHRTSCDVFVSREEFKNDRALSATLGRDRTKDITLDYTKPEREFARQRAIQGFNPASLEQKQEYPLRQQALEVSNVLRPEQDDIKKSLEAFKEEFRRQHPELAKRLDDELRPQHEKQALAFEKQFNQYTKGVEQGRLTSREKTQFEKQTAELAKQPLVMNYLKPNNKNRTANTGYNKK
jgi:hypothetical protein